MSRSSLLQYKEKQKCKRMPCVLTYHPCLRNSFNTIRGHWTSVEKNSKLSKVFPELPMVAFKQPNSLSDLLVRAEMLSPNTTIGKSHSCGDKRCKCCKHMQHSSPYTSKVTGKQYKYFTLLIARVQMLFTFLSVPFVASNTLASLSSPSTHA